MFLDSMLWFTLIIGFVALIAICVWRTAAQASASSALSNAAEQLGLTYDDGVYGSVDGFDIRVTHRNGEYQASIQYDIFFSEPIDVGLLRGESVREFEMEMKKEQIRLITLGDMGVGCRGLLSASSDDVVRNTQKILRFAQQLVAK